MSWILDILCIILLGIIVYQDFKERQISWMTLPVLFICFLLRMLMENKVETVLISLAFNLSFIVFQLILLSLWMSLRLKKWTNIIDRYLGLGDILFFVVLASAFSAREFIVFYLLSLVITVTGFVLYKAIRKNASAEIPLAGAMSIVMIVWTLFSMLSPYIRYNAMAYFQF